jgi:hypothetical protein
MLAYRSVGHQIVGVFIYKPKIAVLAAWHDQFADAAQGILKLHKESNVVELLTSRVSHSSPLEPDTPIIYANDLDVARDGNIYFTTSVDIILHRSASLQQPADQAIAGDCQRLAAVETPVLIATPFRCMTTATLCITTVLASLGSKQH